MPQAPPSDAPRGSSFFGRARESAPVDVPGVSPGQVIGDFRLVRPLGQGGMGQVWEAVQLSLARTVALKLVRPERITEKTLALFAREARAGGRLHHPHLVTVHGHGTDDDIAWIAMELVEGSWTLRDALDDVIKSGDVPPGYYRDVAELVARIADGMQAAHAAGVIHRDLKPQNILVDPDDRPKVTDFGLAKLTDESALSVTGDFAGTYWYTSPEQIAARRMGLDHRTDIFSLGVVLYEMLAQRRPFEGDTTHQVAEQVLTFDPPDLRTVRSRIPRDLAVLTAKCLAKARDRRYATMADLAADLRRYLTNEPIHAKPPSRLVKLVLWARRNPTKSVAGAVAAVAFGVISVLLAENVRKTQRLGVANTSLARTNTTLEQTIEQRNGLIDDLGASNEQLAQQTERATENARFAQLARDEATRKANDVLSLSAQKNLDDLVAEAGLLWPAHPETIPAYVDWLQRAQLLIDGESEDKTLGRKRRPSLAEHRATLAELRSRARPLSDGPVATGTSDEQPQSRAEDVASAAPSIAVAEQVDGRRTFAYDDPEDAWWDRQLSKLVTDLEAFSDPNTGLAGDTLGVPFGWGVKRRHEFARTIGDGSVAGPDARQRWSEASAAIEASPKYGGLRLAPQMGLLPIGTDPESELWEFAHLQTGDPALRGPDGRLMLTEATGVVLVLIPGGTFWMGAQSTDPNGQNYDPHAIPSESPVHEVTLSAHFLSKYETTQGQWLHLTGGNPSGYQRTEDTPLLHPVEQISWFDCVDWTRRIGLSLPSEAQWEHGARGGTDTPWWTGPERESLRGKVNLADQTAKKAGANWPEIYDWLDLEDGCIVHCEVGRFAANGFGLHEMAGNEWEWCLDGFDGYSVTPTTDPVAPLAGSSRVNRGGSFNGAASDARSARRSRHTPGLRGDALGLRVARSISP